MRIYCTKDYKEMSRKAANLISAQVIIKPDCVRSGNRFNTNRNL